MLTVAALAGCGGGKAPPSAQPDAGHATPDAGPAAAPVWSAWPMADHDPEGRRQSPYVGPEAPAERMILDVPNAGTPVIGPDGTLYVPAADERIHALTPTGELIWSATGADPPPPGQVTYPPVIAVGPDGTIYASSRYGPFYALAPDGALRWRYTTGKTFTVGGGDSSTFTPPVPSADGRVYVGEGHLVYAFESDGRLAWTFDEESDVGFATTVVAVDGDVIVKRSAASPPYEILRLSRDGAVKWRYETDAWRSLPSVGLDGTLTVFGDSVTEILDASGTLLRSRSWNWAGSLSRGGDDGFILADVSGIVALNAEGAYRWSFAGGGSLAIVDGRGTTYAGGTGGIYAVDADGRLKWRVQTHELAKGQVLALAADGTLYARYEGTIHALGGGGTCEGTPPDCDDGDPCTVDSCANAVGCVHAAKCVATDSCATSTCAADGSCVLAPVADGTPCDVGFSCSAAQVCRSGACAPIDDGCSLPTAAWPITGHDAGHTSASPLPGPATATLRFPAGVMQPMAFVVAEEGTAILPGASAADAGLRAVDPAGASSPVFPGLSAVGADLILRRDGVLLLSSSESLTAARDGEVLWRFTNGARLGSAALAPSGMLYFGADDYRFYALAPDGRVRWSIATGSATASRPTIAPDGTIYTMAPDLLALTPDADLLWRRSLPTYGQPPVVGADGVIYVLGTEVLTAINPDGSDKWTVSPSATGLAIAADGTLITTFGGTLRALDPAGNERWSFTVPGITDQAAPARVTLTTPVVDGDGNVYVGATVTPGNLFVPPTTATIYALSPGGDLRWSRAFPPAPSASVGGLELGADHTLFFVVSGTLFAIGP